MDYGIGTFKQFKTIFEKYEWSNNIDTTYSNSIGRVYFDNIALEIIFYNKLFVAKNCYHFIRIVLFMMSYKRGNRISIYKYRWE